jgi:coproporphyrinogen III oxidase-like Fe-S oxidoreductase
MTNETIGVAKRLHRELPIFHLPAGERHCLYVPGYVAAVSPEAVAQLKASWEKDITIDDSGLQKTADRLVQLARNAAATWQACTAARFLPECLTVYLSNRCNCACTYCYAAVDKRNRSSVITREAVQSAAELVAYHCREKGKPFRVVFHGGGEPTLHWQLLQQLTALTRRVAATDKIDWWGYIATSGVLPKEKISWLADHFNHIGISCDGPPDIQDRQRPRRGGVPSSPFIEQAARLLCQRKASFSVRATITPETVERQVEIVTYLTEVLGATEVRFEPVYNVRGEGVKGFSPDGAPLFVENFLAAEQKARELGGKLLYSGVRLDELHGTYCDVARDVLHLIPDNTATACFFDVNGRAFQKIGYRDKATSAFILNHRAAAAHRQKSMKIPERCRDCINIYHCARECPEFCEARSQKEARITSPGFRCEVARLLTERWILQLSGGIPLAGRTALNAVSLTCRSDREKVLGTLAAVSSRVDTGEILKQWEAARHFLRDRRRTLPAPVWAQRRFEQDGKEAWRLLRGIIEESPRQAISIYVHVPFCDRRCAFCDCYSFPLKSSQKGEAGLFARTLQNEIYAWAGLGGLAGRKVTTVHFGGGTPNYLEPDILLQLVRGIKSRFRTSDETEWALESTSSMLTAEHIKTLSEWGFTRIHIGVQTLETDVRQHIGRRETAGQVLSKLERLLESGFVVSVDLIYGLPGQTVAGFMDTLEKLVKTGVHGFSLYQLQTGTRNRRFLEKAGVSDRDPLGDYLLLQIADNYLRAKGYQKNHFAHYAYPQDADLYYRHAVRGEDLLALGPTADGVFGTYHYRHGEYHDYLRDTNQNQPGLQGGMFESEIEQRIRQSVARLMGGRISKGSGGEELAIGPLIDSWEGRLLVRRWAKDADYVLTGNGSWFIADMLSELVKNSLQL